MLLSARSLIFSSTLLTTLLTMLLTILLMTGCGFHLRGSVTLPEQMTTTYIQDSNPASLISSKLKRALIKNNVNVIDGVNNTPGASIAVLQLSNERFNQRQLSSGSSTLIKEYELNYTITFSLRNQSNKTLLSTQTIKVTREQTFDETQVLAKTTEQDKMKKEMISDAIRQMLRRLQSIQSSTKQ